MSIFSTLASLRNSLNSVLFKGFVEYPWKSPFWHCLPLKLIYLKTKGKKPNKIKRNYVEDFTLWVCSDADHAAYSLRVTQYA